MDQYVDDAQGLARSVFAGLVPCVLSEPVASARGFIPRGRLMRGAFATGSVLIVGSLAAAGLGPVSAAEARPTPKPRGDHSRPGTSVREAAAATGQAMTATARSAAAQAPMLYRVAPGDTVSSIAGTYGLSTASVLALNGLGWSSIIFPGQQLTLSSAGTVAPVEAVGGASPSGRYTIV